MNGASILSLAKCKYYFYCQNDGSGRPILTFGKRLSVPTFSPGLFLLLMGNHFNQPYNIQCTFSHSL